MLSTSFQRLSVILPRVTLGASVALLLTGCGAASGPPDAPPTKFADITGIYYLASRDGVPMRIVLDDSSGWRRTLITSQLVLHGGQLAQSELFTLTLLRDPAGVDHPERSEEVVVRTMLAADTFRLAGPRYLEGRGWRLNDSTLVVRTDSATRYGSHLWTYMTHITP